MASNSNQTGYRAVLPNLNNCNRDLISDVNGNIPEVDFPGQAWDDGTVMDQIGGNITGMGSSDLANIGWPNMLDSNLSSQVQDISMQQQLSQSRPLSMQPYQCPQPQYQNPMHPGNVEYAQGQGHLPWPSLSPLHSTYQVSQSGSLMGFDYGSRQDGSQTQWDWMQPGPSYLDQQQQLFGPPLLPGQMDRGGQPPRPAQVPNEVDMQALGQLPQQAGQRINPASIETQLLGLQVSQQQPRQPSMQANIGWPNMFDSSLSSQVQDISMQQQLSQPRPSSVYQASQSESLMGFEYGSRQGGSQTQWDWMQLGPSYLDRQEQQQQLFGQPPLPGQMDRDSQPPPRPAQVNDLDAKTTEGLAEFKRIKLSSQARFMDAAQLDRLRADTKDKFWSGVAEAVDRQALFQKKVKGSLKAGRFIIPKDTAKMFFPKVVDGEVKEVTVEDSKGKLWCMSYSLQSGLYQFCAGWCRFIKGHKLSENDFVRFSVDRNGKLFIGPGE